MDEKKRRLLTNRKPPSSADESTTTGSTDTAAAGPSTATKPKPMTKWSIGWRLGVTAIALIILTCGQFLNTNDFFPLGSLTQYATAKDLNGEVNSTCIEAQFPGEDEPRRLGFNTDTVGIERGDIESQLDRVISHPELLQTMADSYERLHPDDPNPETMILCRTVTQLENGQSVGEPAHKILATWEVQ
ncbi:hypothetical protein [Brevibacterium marinum]|uniref:Uncharacterized protein n=1 Tax=Brevibacterium marinum TaxID=418643 RepID=A0A846S4G9_9MICO|nr:hypothetical protein [Brevibacterium marinum]NJC58655.1 hypothetical protein [Brevibacterium marinum]